MRPRSMILFLWVFGSCSPQLTSDAFLEGEVRWITGNQMPGPEQPQTEGIPVIREILVYPPVSYRDLEMQVDGLYMKIPGKPVGRVMSDSLGNFSLALPPGKYSVFTKEDNGFFAGFSDSDGFVSPVTLKEGSNPELRIQINHTAAY